MSLLASISPITAPNSLAIGYINPPTNTLLPKIGSIGLGAVTIPLIAVNVIGELGANKWRDDLLSKVTGRKSVSTDGGNNQGNQPIDPNTVYKWYVPLNGNAQIGYGYFLHIGTYQSALDIQKTYFPENPPYPVFAGTEGNFPSNANELTRIKPALTSDPQTQVPSGLSSGKEEKSSQGISAPPSILGNVPSSALGSANRVISATNTNSSNSSNNSETRRLSPPPSSFTTPPPATTPPPPNKEERRQQEEEKRTEREKQQEDQRRKQEEQRRITPPPPATGDTNRILQELIRIGGISALIRADTTPQAQRNNSKNGACDALNSPNCTKGVEDRIKDPINEKLDAAQVARDANAATQTGLLGRILTKANEIQDFAGKAFNSTKLDKVYNFLTFITVVHNASMLSNSLATTLMDTLSQGLAVFGVKDADNNNIDIQQVLNRQVEDTLKAILGTQNYTTLTENWAKANRIYQAGTQIVWTTRSLWDSARSIQEQTGANVGQLMNSLRREGVVSENAYPAKSESPSMVNRTMERFENLEQAASSLNSVTSEVRSIQDNVNELKSNRENFDKVLKESPKKSGVENDAEKNAVAASKTVSISPAIPTEQLVKPD